MPDSCPPQDSPDLGALSRERQTSQALAPASPLQGNWVVFVPRGQSTGSPLWKTPPSSSFLRCSKARPREMRLPVVGGTREAVDGKRGIPGGASLTQSRRIWAVWELVPRCRPCAVCLVAWLCPALWDPGECSPPGSSVHAGLRAPDVSCVRARG